MVVSSRDMSLAPMWVKEMHAYFAKTGRYRPTDLERVLGDPRKGFTSQDQPAKHREQSENQG